MALVQSLDDVINLLLRRKLVIAATTVVCTLLLASLILQQDRVFRAYAAIQVEGPQVQTSPGGASTSNSAQVMQSIKHRLLTRENLIAIMQRYGPSDVMSDTMSEDDISDLRDAINIDTVADATAGFDNASISAIVISVSTGDAELSAWIANDLAQSILDMSNQGSTARARDTYAFFEGEEERIRNEIVGLEADLAEFQNKNTDSLPVLAEARRTELQDLDAELRALDQLILEATAEKTRLEAQGVQRETDRRRLDELQGTISLLNDKIAFAQKRRGEVMASLSVMPEVEQTISAKKRELMLLQDRYASVSQNFADAETALFLAERQQSERFMLLDRAITPEYAAGVGYKKLLAAGALVSLIVGMLAAVVVELAFPIVRTSAQLERAMGVGALGAIPEVRGLARRSRYKSPGAQVEFYLWNLIVVAAISLVILLVSSGIR